MVESLTDNNEDGPSFVHLKLENAYAASKGGFQDAKAVQYVA